MNAPNSRLSTELATPPETRREKRARLLDELTDLSMGMARRVSARDAAQDLAEPEPETPASATDFSIQFDRVSLGIRRCMMLAERFEQPVVARFVAGSIPDDVERRRVVARRQIIRSVEDSIQREWYGKEVGEFEAELHERVEAGDLDDEIDLRPLEHIIADIRQDFGLGVPAGRRPPWKRRTPADIAALHACAARTQSLPSETGAEPGDITASFPSANDPTLGRGDDPERFFRLVAQPDRA